MKRYVLGFYLTPDGAVLIKRVKPDWQVTLTALNEHRSLLTSVVGLESSHADIVAIDKATARVQAMQRAAPPATGEVGKYELLPCPFCGHEGNEITGEPGMYEILCDGCDHASFAYFHTKWLAATAWNKRQHAPPQGAALPAPVNV